MNKIDYDQLTNEQLVLLIQKGIKANEEYDMKKALDPNFSENSSEIQQLTEAMNIKEFAFEKLYKKNEAFINKIRHDARENNKQFEKDDLDLFAKEGFYYAIQKWNPDKTNGASFTTYAYKVALDFIKQNNYSQGLSIRIPREKRQFISKIKKVQQDFLNKNHRKMTDEECAKALNISLSELQEYYVYSANYSLNRLDAFVDDEQETTLGDLLPDTENDNNDDSQAIGLTEKLVKTVLNEDERYIICSLYGAFGYAKKSEEDLAKETGVTRSFISQRKNKIVSKLKRYLKAQQ